MTKYTSIPFSILVVFLGLSVPFGRAAECHYSSGFTATGPWSGNGDDMGLNQSITYTFDNITNAMKLTAVVSEGGFRDETFSVRWHNVPAANWSVSGGRVKTAVAVVPANPSQLPQLVIADGGTTWANQNPTEEGADISVSHSAECIGCSITQITSTKSPLPLADVCRIVATVFAPSGPCDVKYSIVGPSLNSTIDETTGTLTAGCEPGTLTVRAEIDGDPSNFKEARLEIRGSCSGADCGSIGSGSYLLNSVDAAFSLGLGANGETAGSILLKADAWSPYLLFPSALEYMQQSADVEVLRDDFKTLRQIKAPQGLVDIVVTGTNEYTMSFYTNAFTTVGTSGYYVVTSASPVIVYKIDTPIQDTGLPVIDQELRITEMQGSGTNVIRYFWDYSEKTWRLIRGNGLLVESLAIVATNGTSVRTRTLADGNTNIAHVVVETYATNYPGGEVLIKRVVDPGGAALLTTNTYDGTSGRLLHTLHPDGSTVAYAYNSDGLVASRSATWKDNTTRVDSNTYASSGIELTRPRAVSEEIDGVLTAYTTYEYSTNALGDLIEVVERFASQSATNGDPANLVTTNVYYSDELTNAAAGKIKQVTHEDGRTESHVYDFGSYTITDPGTGSYSFTPGTGTAVRLTVTHGTSASTNGIANKTLREVTIQDAIGRAVIRETQVYTGSGYATIDWQVLEYDAYGHQTKVYHDDGLTEERFWSLCCGKEWEEDRKGFRTDYTYDALRRVSERERAGIRAAFTYDAAGNILAETVSGGALTQSMARAYDLAGRLTNEIDAAGLVTVWSYADGGRTVTRTLPGGATEITARYKDGRTRSITGTGVTPTHYEYGVNGDGSQWTTIYTGGSNAPLWEKTTYDLMSRVAIVESSQGTTNTHIYNANGQLVRIESSSGADTLFEYDALGNQTASGLDVNDNDALDRASQDRISETETEYRQDGGDWWKVDVSKIYAADNSSVATTNGIRKERQTGWPTGIVSEVVNVDVHGNETVSRTEVIRTNRTEILSVTHPDSSQDEVRTLIEGRMASFRTKTGLHSQYVYDGLGRMIAQIEPNGAINLTHYNASGQIDYIEDAASNRTSFGYSVTTGRKIAETNAVGGTTYFAHDLRGNTTSTWGSAVYRVDMMYDNLGRLSEMRTFRDEAGTGDVTRWHYNPASGLLTNKQDAAGEGPTYTYTAAGHLQTRTWARGITATYAYDTVGNLTNVTYSDGTPAVAYTYDRLGRQLAVSDALGARGFAYNERLQLASESITGLYNRVITRLYDSLGRDRGLSVDDGYTGAYGYDAYGRFAALTSTTALATSTYSYSYATNADIVATVLMNNATGAVLTTTRSYDALNRLTSITSSVATGTVSSFAYTYDALHRRTRAELADGSYWLYGYDARGQLVSGRKHWADGEEVSGQQFRYGYDDIGNRTGSTRRASWDSVYQANVLNQYTQRTVAGIADLIGVANPAATVTVNNQPVLRQGEYFHKALSVSNTIADVFAEAVIVGVRSNVGTNGEDAVTQTTGQLFVAESPEPFAYDADGNLVRDGRFAYTWDAENRLVEVETRTNLVSDVPRKKLVFVYDYQGRRVKKVVYSDYTNGAYQATNTTHHLHDGWNVIAELGSVTNTYVWGLDLSGTLQGAGGIGGLLNMRPSTGESGFFYAYDGNGNVVGLIASDAGTSVGEYEYSPFGETLRTTGPHAGENPYRFSTKPFDVETGLGYWGMRYFAPQTGRWLNRDPIWDRLLREQSLMGSSGDDHRSAGAALASDDHEDYTSTASVGVAVVLAVHMERGGIHSDKHENTYLFCLNNAVHAVDPLGEMAIVFHVQRIVPFVQYHGGRLVTWFSYNGQRFSSYLLASAARGRDVHFMWRQQLTSGYQPEFWIRSVQGRADAVNQVSKIVVELKPENAAAIQRGLQQLQRYKIGLERDFPGVCYQTELQVYRLVEQ